MYIINNVVEGKTYRLHDQRSQDLRVIEPRLILTINKTGQLTFQMPYTHPYYNTIKKLKSSLQVLEDGELIYEGRALSDETDMNSTKYIECEGCMGFLIDSVQRPFSITGNIPDFIAFMLGRHNEQVDEWKRIYPGRVNVVDENNQMKRESTTLNNTWNTLMTQLLDVHSGCLWIEHKEGKRYLNYTYDYGGRNEQQIRFGVNLLDLTKYQDATNVVTCLIPYGGEVEYQDELGETQTRTVDITTVNGGADCIKADQEVLDGFGHIWGTCQWPDITDPARLLEKARAYLKESCAIPDSIKLTAVDLNYTGADIRRFRVGYYTTAISKPHGISKDLLLSRLDLFLDDPGKGSISLGATVTGFTGTTVNKQVSISKAVKDSELKTFDEMARKIANATNLITGGFGGYVYLDSTDPATGKKMHPWRILIMNTPDKDTATNIIQLNQNGLGFSTTGINGPYRNAWTIDGNLVADFITTGTMLADRIRGGMLEIGGKGLGKDGRIVVKDAEDREIGYWDKTGLHVLLGVISGTTIIGSSIFGGVIDIGNGTFTVDSDGSVVISSGEISIGNVEIKENYTWLGDFGISSNDSGLFYSRDSAKSVQIASSSWNDWNYYPHIQLEKGDERVSIDPRGISCKDIYLDTLENRYGIEWKSVAKNIIGLWDKIKSLESKIQ